MTFLHRLRVCGLQQISDWVNGAEAHAIDDFVGREHPDCKVRVPDPTKTSSSAASAQLVLGALAGAVSRPW